jgi:hypothetical protein
MRADVALPGDLLSGGNGSVAQLAFGLKPMLEIASVRGAGGEEQLVRAAGNL